MPKKTEIRTSRRLASTVIRGAISILLIGFVVWNLDMSELASTLSTVSVTTLVVLVSIDLFLRFLSAYRWNVLFAALQNSTSMIVIIKISFIASFLGQVLPGTIGVEALRVYGLAKSSNNGPAAFASVVADRMFGLLSLVFVIYIGLLVGPQELQAMILMPATVALAILILFLFLLMYPLPRQWIFAAIPARFLEKLQHRIADVFACLDSYKTKPGVLLYSFVLSILFQLIRVLLFFAAALLIGEAPSFVYFVALVPIVMFAALLPISIGGLGVREASLVVLFSHFNLMDGTQTFTVAILVFVSGIISILPGGWFYMGQRKQLR